LSLVEGLSNPPKPQISCFKRVDIAPDSAGAIQHPGTVMPTGLPITFHDVLTRRDSEADLFDGTLDCDSVIRACVAGILKIDPASYFSTAKAMGRAR
jgi:hypothetical protein